MPKRACEVCRQLIPAERLEILPETRKCVKCSAKFPDPPKFDPEDICAKSSPSGQNGFSPSS